MQSRSTQLPDGVTVFERGWLSANNILIEGPEHCTLVDSGYVTHAPQTLALVTAALGSRPLELLLNTHLHSDHCGGNASLQMQYPALRVEVPPGDAGAVERWDEDALSFRVTGQQCPRFRLDGLLTPGTERQLGTAVWQVHGAPGHDPHSVLFFEPETRTLISADALWENGFGVVFPELTGEPSFDEVASTLDLIESLAPARVIPGHGAVFDDAAAALAVARKRLSGLAANPSKHAWHALKVLVKFKLLEARHVSIHEWRSWCLATPYFELIRARFFAEESFDTVIDEVLADLVRSGAAHRSDDTIYDA